VAARENFGKRRLAGFLPQRLQPLNRLGDLGRASIGLRDNTGDRFAMSCDADGAATLHFVKKLSPLGFGFGSLIFQIVCLGLDQSN
jgi:hypothetical protein